MNPSSERLNYLLQQYAGATCSREELDELFLYIREGKEQETLADFMQAHWDHITPGAALTEKEWEKMYSGMVKPPGLLKNMYRRIAVAAAVLILLGFAANYLLFQSAVKNETVLKKPVPVLQDIAAPGAARAVITLSNGQQIFLDSAANGSVGMQGNVQLTKLADGQIAYSGTNNEMQYNTLQVPLGSKVVKLTLADGSTVWMNAGSSLHYPVAFAGRERKVTVTGEAYFEVASVALNGKEKMPFIVNVNDVRIEVLGTHFNVNAYEDENAVRTTLLEGSVMVAKGNTEQLLAPGQQAQVNPNGQIVLHKNVDTDEVMAWKNGRFEFNGNTIEPIMRQVARWYNVEIEYKGPVPTDNFMGGTSRQENVSELLKILEQTQSVHFRIEGKKIIVMKK